MTSIRFRHEVVEEASTGGHETGDWLILYADVKKLLTDRPDDFEEMLDAVATAYEDEKNDELGEIGIRVVSAVEDSASKIFDLLKDQPNPFDDDDQIYPQRFVAAAVLDFLTGIGVIELPQEEEDSSEGSEDGNSDGSESD